VDPFAEDSVTAGAGFAYFRLHGAPPGKQMYRYTYTDDDLKELYEKCLEMEQVYVLFNNERDDVRGCVAVHEVDRRVSCRNYREHSRGRLDLKAEFLRNIHQVLDHTGVLDRAENYERFIHRGTACEHAMTLHNDTFVVAERVRRVSC
jgi:hypothetical protein